MTFEQTPKEERQQAIGLLGEECDGRGNGQHKGPARDQRGGQREKVGKGLRWLLLQVRGF